ncbi:hypothetical protein MTR67_039248 [Solanum verrucosum]|uniref:Uncharacterized protein n=1 Tax=Solanum verrucosum TaxID=315347 RepID=A0AAF0UGL3_SOLVR|nr:hypothetical protein MTR67_039248 [Solanum verrucosum]
MVADALSRPSMGSVAPIEDDKEELVSDVHRLALIGVHLVHSNGVVVIHNCFESPFISDVKAKQDLDPKLTVLGILFTLEPPRCAMTCGKSIGGIG